MSRVSCPGAIGLSQTHEAEAKTTQRERGKSSLEVPYFGPLHIPSRVIDCRAFSAEVRDSFETETEGGEAKGATNIFLPDRNL